MGRYLGLDTSNYTTSVAAFDAETEALWQVKQLLPVKDGELGLRQSDAVFHHTRQLPTMLERLVGEAGDLSSVAAIGVSVRPTQAEGSYMPCFLSGEGAARQMAALIGVPLHRFSHQQGHVMAALYGADALSLRHAPFLAFHVSGGTTDALLVQPDEESIIRCEKVAGSLDLKAGQLIDRVGGLLGLSFPAGPALEALAGEVDIKLPRPSMEGTSCHLSGVENQCRKRLADGETPSAVAKFCLASVNAAVQAMTERLLSQYGELPVVYAGGVMSNAYLKSSLQQRFGGLFAPPAYSADNAAGIALLTALKAGGDGMTVITVSQLNRYVKSLLEGDANLACVMLGGEISNFTNHYKSGHWYLSLKDEDAIVKAVMFRSAVSRMRFVPENGMKVIVRARVSLYEKDGSFQLYLDDMQPDGAGALQVAFEQLKQRLADEGLFDERRKKPLPRYPRRVGVITSSTGAAVRDIINVLGRRYPLAEVVLIPTLVQGEGAPSQLCAALRRFEEMKAANDPQAPDVILIGRGGGSLEELWAFNDERLARTIAAMSIPVISCVGHETDFTICDFVADLRAPTPSAAAELAVPDAAELLRHIGLLRAAVERSAVASVDKRRRRLTELSAKRCLSSPLYPVEERGLRLDRLVHRFGAAAERITARAGTRLAGAVGKLDAMSPLRVLSRGYALASKDGRVLRSVNDFEDGESFELRLCDGTLPCRVDKGCE